MEFRIVKKTTVYGKILYAPQKKMPNIHIENFYEFIVRYSGETSICGDNHEQWHHSLSDASEIITDYAKNHQPDDKLEFL